MSQHVFITAMSPEGHDPEADSICQMVAQTLQRRGCSTFFAKDDLMPGDPWDEVVPRHLGEARVLVVVANTPTIDNHSNLGDAMEWAGWYELDAIARHGRDQDAGLHRMAVVLQLPGRQVPYGLRRVPHIPCEPNNIGPALQALTEQLNKAYKT